MILVIFFAILAYTIFTYLSFSPYFIDKPFETYLLGIVGGSMCTCSWLYLIRNYSNNNNNLIYFINLFWDVIVCLMFVILPLIFFDIKMDTKSVIGCVIAVMGLIIMKI